jgi:PAS domain S-box-containing protein
MKNLDCAHQTQKRLEIIIIKASIGALNALKTFFSLFTKTKSLSFIIMSDLSPRQASALMNFFKKYTPLQICFMESHTKIQPDTIYIYQSSIKTQINNGIFYVDQSEKLLNYQHQNIFIKSLLKENHIKTALVILSCYLKFDLPMFTMIKNAGGLIIAQDPKTAIYSSTLHSVEQTGLVDLSLSLEQMGLELNHYFLENNYQIKPKKNPKNNSAEKLILFTNKNETEKMLRDITDYQLAIELQNDELLKSQLELAEQRDKYVDLYNLAPIAYFTFDNKALIIEVNQTGADLLCIAKEHLFNKCFSRYVDPKYQALFYEHLEKVLETRQTQSSEIKLLRRKGSLFYAKLISKSVIDSETHQPQILTFVTDITEQKKIEDSLHHHQVRLAQVDRINSTSKLASILAHEINNPIGVITNYIHGCVYRLKSANFNTNELIDVLNRAAHQIKHISDIILRMKNFSCMNQLQFEQHSINQVIQEAINFVYYETFDFPVSITFRPLKYAKPIMLDKIHIQQVILNLARNAIEAMQEAKTLDPKLMIETNLIDTKVIEVIVNDNGPGISIEHKHQLFDLHFTTKPYGTGLGLAVSRAIIEAHKGELKIQNNHLNGASFKFTLSL